MELYKIVLTGGPCAGKSSAKKWILEAFSQKGYTVLFIAETATELISGGIAPWTCRTTAEFQDCVFNLQMEKEKMYEQGARSMDCEKVLLVCDRGAMDCRAYMSEEDFQYTLAKAKKSEEELLREYAGVFHLESGAKGNAYTTRNNSARKESEEEAIVLDDKAIMAWEKHPYFRIIKNTECFEDKMKHLIIEISTLLETL